MLKAKFADGNARSRLTSDGKEILDPRPVELAVAFKQPESIQQLIKRLVTDPAIREDLAATEAIETFEEADDFDVADDLPINSPYEEQFDPMGLLAREQEIKSGAVKDRSPEEKQEAAELARKVKSFAEARRKAKLAPRDSTTT